MDQNVHNFVVFISFSVFENTVITKSSNQKQFLKPQRIALGQTQQYIIDVKRLDGALVTHSDRTPPPGDKNVYHDARPLIHG